MIRLAALALLLAPTATGAVEPAGADAAMKRYREVFRPSAGGCERPEGEISVCGRRIGPDPNRLPLPVQPLPGARESGEPPDANEVQQAAAEPCSNVGPEAKCGGVIPLIPLAIFAVKTAVKAAKGRD